MKLAYEAIDRGGKSVTGVIDAIDSSDAGEQLRRQGLFTVAMGPASHEQTVSAAARGGSWMGATSRLKGLAMFTRQLQVLVSTGTPLVQSLAALQRQASEPAWRAVIEEVRHAVEDGSTLAAALEAHPRYFDTVYRSLIAAGESGGHLDQLLGRLAALTRQQLRVRSSITGAMVYPTLLVGIAIVVIGVMIGFVLPRFAGLYASLDAPLPPSTQLLMSTSDIVRDWWWLVLVGLAGAITCLVLWLRSAPGRRAIDHALVHLPQIGRLTRNFCAARLTRVLGVLLESHVPLHDALGLARDCTGNCLYGELVEAARDAVTQGQPMSSAFAGSSLLSEYVCEAIRNAEQSGQVGPLLLSVADFLDEENDVSLRSLTTIIEPVILIVLGVIVGLIAVSMFMPLLDLTAMTGGGGS